MKYILLITSIIVMLIVQGCSNGLATSKTDDIMEEPVASSSDSNTDLNKMSPTNIPEMQIIREMYQSGCSIKQLELNRRQQNLRISCTDERAGGFTTGTL